MAHNHSHQGHGHSHDHEHDHGAETELTFVDCHKHAGEATRLDLRLLIPDGPECTKCGDRIIQQFENKRGIESIHLETSGDGRQLCIHYDPNLLPIAALRRDLEAAGASVDQSVAHASWKITDMDCADCAQSIEHVLGRLAGITHVSVNYAAERIHVEFDSRTIQEKAIRKKVNWLGYDIQDLDDAHGHDHSHDHGAGMTGAVSSGILLAMGFITETWTNLPISIAIALYAGAYLTGGWDAARHGIKAALKLRFDIDFLMVVAAIGAAVLGEWAEGGLLLFLFSLGHALEHMAMDKARNAMHALGELTPKTARIKRNGKEKEIPIQQVQRDDEVIVRPGERVPVDGTVIKGTSSLDQSAITGESIPIEASADANVFAGSVNGDGSLTIRVTKLASESTLARIVKLVEEAQTQKSSTQRFTERFSRIFVPASLIFVILVIAVPAILNLAKQTTGIATLALPFDDAFLRGMTILIAVSPCALAISTPAAVLSGIAQAARTGVLVKGGAHLENLGTVHTVAFDKTGTLTMGRPTVTDTFTHECTEDELIRIAAAAEAHSTHPLAKAVVQHANGIDLPESENLQSLPGQGINATIDGKTAALGNQRMFPDLPELLRAQVEHLESQGKTTIIVRHGDRFLGVIAVADRVRPEAKQVIQRLKKNGVQRIVMLTGDHDIVANVIAKQIGITEVQANLLPEDKVAAIRDLAKQGPVAMVGDGINDAPAMANATVGIAMAAHGTDVAMETADIALMADSLERLPFALGVSRKSRTIIKQNLFVSLATIALLIPFALFGWVGIGIAIIFHEGSTIGVVGNALRLLRFKEAA